MKNLFKTIISIFVFFVFFGSNLTAFADWDMITSGNYSGAPDVITSGNYFGTPDVITTGNYGGWDPTVITSGNTAGSPDVITSGNYTGVPDTITTGNSIGGWDSAPTVITSGNYSGAPDVITSGNYFGTPDVITSGNYGGGWDNTPVTVPGTVTTGGWDSTPVTVAGNTTGGWDYTPVTTPSYVYTPGYTYTAPVISGSTYGEWTGGYTSPSYGNVGSTYGVNYAYPAPYIAPTLYGSSGSTYGGGYGYVGSINTGNYGYIGSTYNNNNNNNTTTYTNAWCQSIGWDYVTDTVHGYCQCNTGRSYSGDLTTGRGGVCRPNQTACTQEAKLCPDGSYVSRTEPGCNFAACPVPTQPLCPTGSSRVGNTCVIDTVNCPTGTSRGANGTCINNTVISTYTCPNGSVVSYAFQCPIITPTPTYTYSNYTYPTAPSYSYSGSSYGYGYTAPVINYQVCWDGSTISGNQICPAQYKTCLNGSYVAFNQSCYAVTTPNYVAPPVVKFNNVVTSIITQITNTSGRCNGIGLIANGADSTGWFEYGETANLGRVTAKASIGRDLTAPFSNVLANLKPTTKYYCRAVMQNQYGIVKGEIVSFVTKSKVTSYVKPVVSTKKVVTKKAVTTKKSEVVCVDGSYVSVKNESSATMLNQGEKLMMLQVEKGEGNLVANSHVSYRVMYRNLSNARLTGVLVKVVVPAELKFTSATAGNYDDGTHTLTLNQDSIDAYSEGVITIRGDISSDAPVGKTIVTTAYALYTVPGTHAQDEVTAYVVGSILPANNISNLDTGAKKVIGSDNDRGFMPSNLVEWLALIAIIFIIFILGRSIYVSYKEGEGKAEKH